MRRVLAFAATALLVAAAGAAVRRIVPPPAAPIAIDDPASGDVVLWPGSADQDRAPDEQPAPAMRVVPCELGPSTLPILPERTV